MSWHYIEGGKSVGPVATEQFAERTQNGRITDETLVWREGMGEWSRWADVKLAELSPDKNGGMALCAETGMLFPRAEMIRYGEVYVSALGKMAFFQKIVEGVQAGQARQIEYGGFWRRAAAKIIDGVVLYSIQFTLGMMVQIMATFEGGPLNPRSGIAIVVAITYALLGIAASQAYPTFFLGRYGATLGKMAMGMKVVRADGEKITYVRALGRTLCEILSGLLLFGGYLIAVSDEERRTLHDELCDTRVIRKI